METGHPSTRAVNSGSGNRALVLEGHSTMVLKRMSGKGENQLTQVYMEGWPLNQHVCVFGSIILLLICCCLLLTRFQFSVQRGNCCSVCCMCQWKGSQPRPFAVVQLGLGEDIVDCAWNPGQDFAGLFAVCLSKGGVQLLELRGSSVVQVASLPAGTAATCRMFSLFFSLSVLVVFSFLKT